MLVNGTCQIPDPVYKLVGSIVCFYIPLGVMLLTYCLTVRLLARQRQNLGGGQPTSAATPGWASGWLGQAPALGKFMKSQESQSNIFFIFYIYTLKKGILILAGNLQRTLADISETMNFVHPFASCNTN